MERAVRAKARRTKINKAIIGTLAVSGVVAVGVLAPNALKMFGRAGLINPDQKKQSVQKSLTRLIRQGYVVLEGGKARLAPKGEKFAALIGAGRLALKRPKRWDGRWRLLVFDIPERRRSTRIQIRTTLQHLGLFRLQDSVWVYPYDCEDVVTILKADLHVGKDLLYVIADKVEYDLPLRKHFRLS